MRKLFGTLSARSAFEGIATFLGITVIIIFLFIYRGDVINTAKNLNLITITIIILTISVQTAMRSLRDGLLYSALGSKIPFPAIYNIQIKQVLLNHLPLKPGTIYAALSLREQHGISLASYASVFLAQSILTLGLALIIASSVLALANGFSQLGTIISTAALGAISLSLFYIPLPPITRRANAFITLLRNLHLGMATLSARKRLLIITVILGSAGIFLNAWRIYVILSATGVEANFSNAIIFSVGIYLSLFISITPAGVGIREGIVAAAAEVLSVSVVAAVIATSLERFFVIIYCAIVITIGKVLRSAR